MVRGDFDAIDPSLKVSTAAQDLIARMLQADATRRISIEDIKQHPWFTHKLRTDLLATCTSNASDFEMQEAEEEQSIAAQVAEMVAMAGNIGHPGEEPCSVRFVGPDVDDGDMHGNRNSSRISSAGSSGRRRLLVKMSRLFSKSAGSTATSGMHTD
jgi:serine/threonine protein kinase